MAEHLQALELPGIYCTQAEPDVEELEDLIKAKQEKEHAIETLKNDHEKF